MANCNTSKVGLSLCGFQPMQSSYKRTVGCYIQSNVEMGEDPTAYGESTLTELRVWDVPTTR
jgi:hypothetical protein